MTTTNKVIVKVDGLRKNNAVPREVKAGWIVDLDGRIDAEVVKGTDYAALVYPAGGDTELLADAPYESIYTLYVLSMVDLAMNDFNNYHASAKRFNDEYDEFAAWYRRNNVPSQPASVINLWN